MMDKAYEAAVAAGLGNSYTLLRQGDIPKEKLINAFTHDINSILFATASFWEGVSVDGESLTTVIIDRLPFPRPGEPIIDALRARAGDGYNAFMAVDVPIASTRLAQGVGRLIRTTQDKGVVIHDLQKKGTVISCLKAYQTTNGYVLGMLLKSSIKPSRTCYLVESNDFLAVVSPVTTESRHKSIRIKIFFDV